MIKFFYIFYLNSENPVLIDYCDREDKKQACILLDHTCFWTVLCEPEDIGNNPDRVSIIYPCILLVSYVSLHLIGWLYKSAFYWTTLASGLYLVNPPS